MSALSWLHLTDLHRGITDQDHLWPNVENDFYEDLELLHRLSGPWDLVLFTGDLTQRGSEAEFQSLDRLLSSLAARLRSLGSDPVLLAVPGNHDLIRPAEPLSPAAEVLSQWAYHPRAQRAFWSQADSPYRALINEVFRPYSAWWARPERPFRRPSAAGYRAGVLPGDFSAVIAKGAHRFGVVGLNTAFLQLEGGEYQGRVAVHTSQFHGACGGNGPQWAKDCDVCLLLTHHPPDWLEPRSRDEHYGAHLIDFFAVHLYGHMHDHQAHGLLHPGARPRYSSQGCSLFGLESAGDNKPILRQHGYAAGRIEVSPERASLRLWPRLAVKTMRGSWQIVPDNRFGRLEADHGTRAMPVEVLRKQAPAPAANGDDNDHKPAVPQPAGNAYDPRWYVERTREETRVLANLANDGAPATVVWGPALHGKTWFLKHVIKRAQQTEPKPTIVEVNIGAVAEEHLATRAVFLFELGRRIAHELGNEGWVNEAWSALPNNPGQALSLLMERRVLPAAPRVILVLENFHVLLTRDFHDQLFSLFRAWNQDASRAPWAALRLMLGMSIEPERFAEQPDTSGFLNSALKVQIGGFHVEHAKKLRELYRVRWSDEELQRVLDWVKRHPYLLRSAMYECATGTTLEDLLAPRSTGTIQFQGLMARLLGKIK